MIVEIVVLVTKDGKYNAGGFTGMTGDESDFLYDGLETDGEVARVKVVANVDLVELFPVTPTIVGRVQEPPDAQ